MEKKLSKIGFAARLALLVLPALALALGAFALPNAQEVSAAGKLNAWLGQGCKVQNGVKTIKLTANAKSTGSVTIKHVTLNLQGSGNVIDDELSPQPQSYSKTYQSTIANGTYTMTLTVTGQDGASFPTRTVNGKAEITNNGCKVSIVFLP